MTEWQKINAPGGESYRWDDANLYCSNLILNHRSDWIFPTKDEMVSLIDNSFETNKIVKELRDTTSGRYWTYV